MGTKDIIDAIATLNNIISYNSENYTKKQVKAFKKKVVQLVSLLTI